MKTIFHALEPKVLQQFIEAKKELLEVAASMTAKERAEGRKEIMEAAVLYEVPEGLEDMSELYLVNESGVASIPIVGKLTPQADICDGFFSSCTTYGFIQEATKAADNDPRVREIEYNISSGGGYVDGCDVTGQVIAGCGKKTTAVVSGMAASAAYWIASQCDQIILTAPTDFVGSIGVAVEFIDTRKREEAAGIKRIVLTSTDAPDKRIDIATEEGQAKEIEELDAIHAVFVSRISSGRNVSKDKINQDFGKGGVVIASKALEVGMVDGIRNAIVPSTQTPAAAGKPKEGEVTTMTLEQLLAANPEAQKEYDSNIATARTEGEAAGKEVMKEAYAAAVPILSSASYPDTVKNRVGEKAAAGDVEGLKDFVAMHDMMNEAGKSATATDEQGKDTPAQTEKINKDDGLINNDNYAEAVAELKGGTE